MTVSTLLEAKPAGGAPASSLWGRLFGKAPGVWAASAEAKGFDTDTVLTADSAKAFAQAGFTFVVRYLARGSTESSGDLTYEEVQAILGAKLALMAVQHVSSPGWWPTAALGQTYGENACNNATSAELPEGLSLWLDLEGVNAGASATDVSAYCEAWYQQVASAKFIPGLYLGYDAILTPSQIDALPFAYFWKAGGNTPYPANGFCMVQSISNTYVLDNVSYDSDVIQADNLGQTPFWYTTRPTPATPAKPSVAGKVSAAAGKLPKLKVPAKGIAWLLGVLLVYIAGAYTGPAVLPKVKAAVSAWVTHLKAVKK